MGIEVYCDGSIMRNPGGVGAWCAILVVDEKWKVLEDYDLSTTNNRMELMAAIEGLRYFHHGKQIKLYSDSQYVIKGFTEGRVEKWAASNWTRKTRKKAVSPNGDGAYANGYNGGVERIPNADLWEQLAGQDLAHDVEWIHYRGQHDDPSALDGPEFFLAMAHRFALSLARMAQECQERGFAIPDMPKTLEERYALIERIKHFTPPPDPPPFKPAPVYAVYSYTNYNSESYSGPKFIPIGSSLADDGGKAACEKAAAVMNRTDDTKEMGKFRTIYRDRYFVKQYSGPSVASGVELGQDAEGVV